MKPFYQSKTLWANIFALGLIVAAHYGISVPAPDAAQMAAFNLVLRLLTSSGLTLK